MQDLAWSTYKKATDKEKQSSPANLQRSLEKLLENPKLITRASKETRQALINLLQPVDSDYGQSFAMFLRHYPELEKLSTQVLKVLKAANKQKPKPVTPSSPLIEKNPTQAEVTNPPGSEHPFVEHVKTFLKHENNHPEKWKNNRRIAFELYRILHARPIYMMTLADYKALQAVLEPHKDAIAAANYSSLTELAGRLLDPQPSLIPVLQTEQVKPRWQRIAIGILNALTEPESLIFRSKKTKP